MRLVTPAALCLAAAAVLLPVPAPASAAPSCAGFGGREFPLVTRIHGGPDSYDAGGGFGTWFVDVTNTTDRTCANIHPVVVLVDEARALKAAQPRLEFYAGRHPHPVRFETTDEDELVGAFEAGDFAGFTVGPGATTRVKVRLSVTSDAVANEVTASAAVVQRQDNDGDWVGQSNDYRFAVHGDPDTDTDTDSGTDSATEPPADQDPSAVPTPEPSDADGRVTLADELARTGLGSPRTALTVAGVLLVAGGTLLLARRRR